MASILLRDLDIDDATSFSNAKTKLLLRHMTRGGIKLKQAYTAR